MKKPKPLSEAEAKAVLDKARESRAAAASEKIKAVCDSDTVALAAVIQINGHAINLAALLNVPISWQVIAVE